MSPADLVCDHGEAPKGVSPVAAAFLRLHIHDIVATQPTDPNHVGILRIAQGTDSLNPLLLTEGIINAMAIDLMDTGGATLMDAYDVLRDAVWLDERNRKLSAEACLHLSASLAGEALAEWIIVHDWPAWGDQNHPYTVLLQGCMWATSHAKEAGR